MVREVSCDGCGVRLHGCEVPGESVYGEKRLVAESAEGEEKTEYRGALEGTGWE